MQRRQMRSTPNFNQQHTTVHTGAFIYLISIYDFVTLMQLSWTGQCGDVDERSGANTGNTSRGCRVAETTETDDKNYSNEYYKCLNIFIYIVRNRQLFVTAL